ncbi:MAG: UbiA family prenyltransferase, partial [Luteolibacter sp.]
LGGGVLLGCATEGAGFAWPWALSVAAVLFYVSGNFLNDWADREWDAEHRPERALPRGLFREGDYFKVAVGGMGLSLVVAGFYGWVALLVAAVLVGLIVLYTRVHKKVGWSGVPMGLCRACLPVLGFVAVRGSMGGQVLFPAVGVLVYVVALSLSARGESRPDVVQGEKWRARGMLAGSGLIAALLPVMIMPVVGWIGLLPFFLWLGLCVTKYQSPVPAHVSALLAGIPLVDWIVLFPMALVWLKLERVEVGGGMFLTALLFAPFCFVLGRALQRLAPAT